MYVTYLTIYEGDKMPPFYLGSTSEKKINEGYHGSVRSKKYRAIWNQELKENPDLFDTIVLDGFETRNESLVAELSLQKKHKVVTSPLFINMGLAQKGFVNPGFFTDEQLAKMSASAKARGMSKALMDAAHSGRRGMKDSDEVKSRRNTTLSISQQKRMATMSEEQRKVFGKGTRGKPWTAARRAAHNATKGT